MLRRFGVKDRYAKAFDVAVVLFGLVGAVQLAFWFDYRAPVTVHERVFKNLHVPAGGLFIYENHFTRTRYCNTRVDRWFVGSDKVIRRIDPLPSAMPTEGLNQRQVSEAKIQVPPQMPPGPSRSCFQSHWQCTPVQRLWPINGDVTCFDFTVEPPGPISLWLPEPLTNLAMETEP